MNPRNFCRQRAFHKTLLLTYSFDPIFFEQIILPDLWAGRSGDILVLGDQGQLEEAVSVRAGQLWHLGKRYLLAPARHAGAFHPKVTLRLGAKDGMIMVGSGNLTSSGWGGNQELGTSWPIGPDHPDRGEWLHGFLAQAMLWCSGELEREAIARMRDTPWLSLMPESETRSDLLFSRGDTSLSSLLVDRWRERRFDAVKILTGSTDEAGAFLRWAHATFGIRRATVVLTPAMASLDPQQIANLPLEVNVVVAPERSVLHAKFYWFEGEAGATAVMGSANCSAAAWLLSPNRGGNIETVVVYDQAEEQDYSEVLKLFDREPMLPGALLGRGSALEAQVSTRKPFRLKGLHWHRESGHVEALLHPIPASGSEVELLLGKSVIAMAASTGDGGVWRCTPSDPLADATVFASIRVTNSQGVFETDPRWIDDLMGLRDASQSARLLEPFKALERAATSSEQRQMLVDLQEVAHALFNDSGAFKDPSWSGSEARKEENHAEAPPVDPNNLVCHLEEVPGTPFGVAESRAGTLSISGILRMLFDLEGDAADQRDPRGVEVEDDASEGSVPSGHPTGDKADGTSSGLVEAKFRQKLADQIETFLNKLRSLEFASRCSATQMVQAVAFPLAIAVRGKRHGWVSQENSECWAIETISLLLRGDGPRAIPLLNAVENRYRKNGQAELFSDVVGNGTLWVALVSLLGGSRWDSPGGYLEKAIALREVFESQPLMKASSPESIKQLVGKINVEDASRYLTRVAPAARSCLSELESSLAPIWQNEATTQKDRRIQNGVGDVLWRDKAGWAVCLEESVVGDVPTRVRLHGQEKPIVAGFFVNVSEASLRHVELAVRLKELRSLVDAESVPS